MLTPYLEIQIMSAMYDLILINKHSNMAVGLNIWAQDSTYLALNSRSTTCYLHEFGQIFELPNA